MMQSTTDTEVILHLIARSRRNRFVDRFIDALRQLEGAYAFVGLTNKKLIGARDPLGIRPLVLGELDGCPILASETCALDIIGAQVSCATSRTARWWSSTRTARSRTSRSRRCAARPCIFEYIYFARPDSIVGGRSVYDVRKAMGARARARSAGRGRRRSCRCRIPACRRRSASRRQSGIPFELGIIRNHYVGRTFIQPTQAIRDSGVRMKHSRQPRRGRTASASCWSTTPSCAAPPRARSCR